MVDYEKLSKKLDDECKEAKKANESKQFVQISLEYYEELLQKSVIVNGLLEMGEIEEKHLLYLNTALIGLKKLLGGK